MLSKRKGHVDKKTKGSPSKKPFIIPTAKKNTGFQIIVAGGFHEMFPIEVAAFVKNSDTKDGYLNTIKQVIKGEITVDCPEFDACNFYAAFPRRQPKGPSVSMKDPPTHMYQRYVFVRYLQDGQESTSETCDEMYQGILPMVTDEAHSKWPAENVVKVDVSGGEKGRPLLALDEWFLDQQIEEFIKRYVDEDDLNPDFAAKYPDFAKLIYKGKYPSSYAKTLGFESEMF